MPGLPRWSRRVLLLLWVATASAMAQDHYPNRPVTLIVPQVVGGANDVIARIVGQRLGVQMNQQFIVDNRVGAGGNIGTVLAAQAKPDGYTLLLTTNGAHTINPALYRKPGFDPVKDFEPVATVATAGYVLVANPSFPADNLAQLIALAKKEPGSITIASAGNGTLNHLVGEMLQHAAGIQLQHVPYKGAVAAVRDVVGGQVQLAVASVASALPLIKAGKLKILAVTNESRVAALPDVPTAGETVKGFGSTPWYGVLAPKGTPKVIVQQLEAQIVKAVADPEVREQLLQQGCDSWPHSGAEFAKIISDELPQWVKIVKESGATID